MASLSSSHAAAPRGDNAIRAIASSSVRKIVAGQLITDATSVVRELLENACDGGATQVTITLSPQLDTIELKDNGRGIAADGRALLCSANATSKISNFEDIYSIDAEHGAYGFRGEALHLMGQACHELIITTRTSSETEAERIRVVDGERQPDAETCVAPIGTTVRMVGLFASIPVRLKQLHANVKKEQQHIERLCYVYALSHPSLRLVCGPKPKLTKAAAADLGATIKSLFSAPLFNQLCAVKWRSDDGQFDISGMWPTRDANWDIKDVTRGRSNDRMFLFVNGRPANDSTIERAITMCFRTHTLTKNSSARYPFVVLDIRVPRAQYDVNLSPDKRDFLFRGKDILKSHILTALEDSIGVEIGSTVELNKRGARTKIIPDNDRDTKSSDNHDHDHDNDTNDISSMSLTNHDNKDDDNDNDGQDNNDTRVTNTNDNDNVQVFRMKQESLIKNEMKSVNRDAIAAKRVTATAGARLILEDPPTPLRQSKLSLTGARKAGAIASSSSSSVSSSIDDINDTTPSSPLSSSDDIVVTTPKKRAVTTKNDRPIASKIATGTTPANAPIKRTASERKKAAADIVSSTRVDAPESRKRKAVQHIDDNDDDDTVIKDDIDDKNDSDTSSERPMITTDIEDDDNDDLGESLSMLEELVRWDLPQALSRFNTQVVQHEVIPSTSSSNDINDRVGSVQILGVLDGGVNYITQSIITRNDTKQPVNSDQKSSSSIAVGLPDHVTRWLASLRVVNRARLEERLCYDRLTHSLELSMSELDEAVTLDDSLSITSHQRDQLITLLTADQQNKDDAGTATNDTATSISVTRAFALCGFKLRVRTTPTEKFVDILAVPKDQSMTITEFVDLCDRLLASSSVMASLRDPALLPCRIPIHAVTTYRADAMLRHFRQEASRLAATAAKQVRALPRDKLKRLLHSVVQAQQCGTDMQLHDAACSCLHAQPIFMPLVTKVVPIP